MSPRPALPTARGPRRLALLLGLCAVLGLGEVARRALREPATETGPKGILSSPLFVAEAGTGRLVTAPEARELFNVQSFAAHKAPGTLRIVCVGGDATFGVPFDGATSFAGWLAAVLPRVAPGTPVEVINAGGRGLSGAQAAHLAQGLLIYAPDVLVLLAQPERMIPTCPTPDWPEGAEERRLGAVSDMLGIRSLVTKARDAGSQVLLVTPPSRLRDCPPFESVWAEAPGSADRLAAEALLAGPLAAGLDEWQAVAARHGGHAALQYGLAQAFAAAGRTDEAQAAFASARDADDSWRRPSREFIAALRDLALQEDLGLVDFAARMDAADAPDAAAPRAADLFLDHVHLSARGQFELALDILDVLVARGLLQPAPGATTTLRAEVDAWLDRRPEPGLWRTGMLALAAELQALGRHEQAGPLIDATLALDTDAEALVLRGHGEFVRGEVAAAEASYRAAITADGSALAPRLSLAELLRSSGRLAHAAAEARSAVDQHPDEPTAHLLLGVVQDELGEGGAARNSYQRALRLQPGLTDAHNRLGVSLLKAGDAQAAEAALRAAVAADPRSARAAHNLGVLLAETNRLDEAVHLLSLAVAIDPTRAGSRHKLGMALVLLERVDEGLAELEAATALAPGDTRIARDLIHARTLAGMAR